MLVRVNIHSRLKDLLPGFRLGYLIYKNAMVKETTSERWQELLDLGANLQQTYGLENLVDIPGIREGRKAFKTLGVDPARYRPSAEALIRRVLQEKGLGSVNSAVDANNYASVQFGLPFGLYNIDALQGNVVCRTGEVGESYLGLSGREVSLKGKLLTADNIGPFGSPVVDSERTCVDSEATNLLQIIYIFPGYNLPDALLEQVGQGFEKFTQGKVVEFGLVD